MGIPSRRDVTRVRLAGWALADEHPARPAVPRRLV